jgi:hypothetical protein
MATSGFLGLKIRSCATSYGNHWNFFPLQDLEFGPI